MAVRMVRSSLYEASRTADNTVETNRSNIYAGSFSHRDRRATRQTPLPSRAAAAPHGAECLSHARERS